MDLYFSENFSPSRHSSFSELVCQRITKPIITDLQIIFSSVGREGQRTFDVGVFEFRPDVWRERPPTGCNAEQIQRLP